MISFCYADRCYRAFILDYFGDRSHKPTCGTCGVCLKETTQAAKAIAVEEPDDYVESSFYDEESPFGSTRDSSEIVSSSAPASPRTRLEKLVIENTPFASDLEKDSTAVARGARRREARVLVRSLTSVCKLPERALGDDETCACGKASPAPRAWKGVSARHPGLHSCADRARQHLQFILEGLLHLRSLSNMTDEVLLYVTRSSSAGGLRGTGGNYPNVAVTEYRIRRDRERAASNRVANRPTVERRP